MQVRVICSSFRYFTILPFCYLNLHPVHFNDFLLGLSKNVVFLTNFLECIESFFEMMDLVACRDLCADPGLALRHDREEEPYCIDTFFVEVP